MRARKGLLSCRMGGAVAVQARSQILKLLTRLSTSDLRVPFLRLISFSEALPRRAWGKRPSSGD